MDKVLILQKIQEHYGFKKDADFADFLGIKPNTLSNWRTRGTIDYERIITKCVDIDANWLMTGEGAMLKGSEVVRESFTHKIPTIVTTDSHQRDNVVLVPVKAQAGYLNGFGDPKFISKLPAFRLPNIENGVFRMFQVAGLSMYPTLPKNSFVVGQWVENWEDDVKDNRIYVVVSKDEGVIVKRVINRILKYNNLMCKSDNRSGYPTINVLPSTVSELWEVKLHLNFELPDPADIYDRMNDLEVEMEQLKLLIKA